MDRWPNWIRRGATDSEILDSSSRRSTNKKIKKLLQKNFKKFQRNQPLYMQRLNVK